MSPQSNLVVIEQDVLGRMVEQHVNLAVKDALKNRAEDVQELKEKIYALKTWLTLKEAGAYLGVQPCTVKAYTDRGLPYSKPGKFLLFKRDDLDEWIEEHRVD